MPALDATQAIEQAARDSYGRLLAFLATRSRDLAAAEDALSDAFHAALETWPRSGVPEKPEAWLLVAARRRLLDAARHARVHAHAAPELTAAAEEARKFVNAEIVFPDERLKLLFICAHPAIDRAVRTPLMLQTVLGLDAARIASAFLVRPAAMSQRLSRAKGKIRDAHIRFEIPEPKELPPRLGAVLEAIYAAYGSGWEDISGVDARRKGLAREAIDLGRLLAHFMPTEPEVLGLLSLMLYCESRRAARRTPAGAYVPLSEQDVDLWSQEAIGEADRHLRSASETACIGPFQLEAAIQSVHAHRTASGKTDWQAISVLYEALVRLAPTTGALVGRAAAIAEVRGAAAGWELLQELPADTVRGYQPYWVLAAHLLRSTGRLEEAVEAYTNAIGLCGDPAVRKFLFEQRSQIA